jgi:hypothetical protein
MYMQEHNALSTGKNPSGQKIYADQRITMATFAEVVREGPTGTAVLDTYRVRVAGRGGEDITELAWVREFAPFFFPCPTNRLSRRVAVTFVWLAAVLSLLLCLCCGRHGTNE